MHALEFDRAGGVAEVLSDLMPGAVLRDVPLSTLSAWKIGGRASLIVRPRSVAELSRLRAFLHASALPHLVIGATSNLLFSDEGLRVVCIQIGGDFARTQVQGATITAEPGAWVPGLARLALHHGLAGLAHTCGIPGTLGGLVCMNGGSQRKGVGEVVDAVTSVAPDGTLVTRSGPECGFAYRRSIFQRNGEVIAESRLALQSAADRAALRREMVAILADRRRKFPRKLPNCGSVFVSNPAMHADYGPPGAIIERLGLKGRRIGGAQISPQHGNFIVNLGGATARDVLALVTETREVVCRATGYLMQVEVRLVGPYGTVRPAHH